MASKTKKHRATRVPVVRGPQTDLPIGPAAGEPLGIAEGRTPRMRYVEPPHKREGNPFFAVRVPREVLAAFRKKCDKRKVTPQGVVRAYMAKWAGVKLPEVDHGDH